MKFRSTCGLTALAACLLGSTSPQAATITGSFGAWQAAGGNVTLSSTLGTADGITPVASITLNNAAGTIVTLAGTADTVLQPGSNVIPLANGYTGQVLDTSNTTGTGAATETFTFAAPVTSFGVFVAPDFGLFATSTTDTFTVTLSNGQSTSISGNYAPVPSLGLATQFIGYTGGAAITSITIAATNTSDGDLFVGAAVPEPMSMALLLTGVTGLAGLRRRARA